MSQATDQAIAAIWRIEAPRLLGGLLRLVRDLSRAEDLAQEALLAALAKWPQDGIPERPGAWLMAAARNRALDELRRARMMKEKHTLLAASELEQAPPAEPPPLGDDVLRLVLVACHPILSAEARVALTLRLVVGLSTEEIARAFLVPEPTIGQRIVRAKRAIGEARVPFEVPEGAELTERLASVLEVVYLLFNEGYAATRGAEWVRRALLEDALRLGRALAALVPGGAEVHGLLALMELQASRARARLDAAGEIVLLERQNRALWDRAQIHRGLAALERAESLARPLGPYTVQAAIAACHARAPSVEQTDWPRVVALYDALLALSGSPVVALNRAVAVAYAEGPAAGLALVDALAAEPALAGYHLLPSVQADLLLRLGRREEARAALGRALAQCRNDAERRLLERRLAGA